MSGNEDEVMFLLSTMGVTGADFGSAAEFEQLCEKKYSEQRLWMLNKLNRFSDEEVPDDMEQYVVNRAAGCVLQALRFRDPSRLTYIKYQSSGTDTYQFALMNATKNMDPVEQLMYVPTAEIRSHRRLFRSCIGRE